ncbi:hypothetical protein ACJMK2_010735 [Sinanodonta woodiana]|uniref:Apple domain-containing protein n=1 Tax=Sinanodonta woodiana TaxID=1069815 RepID=A0ABD3VGC3_SINWO
MYVWPLANITVYKEVMQGDDAELLENQQCFQFSSGPPSISYSVVTFDGSSNSYFDIHMNKPYLLEDMTISLYVYPGGDVSGSLIHFKSDNGDLINIRVVMNTIIISFRDPYGMNAGLVYLETFFTLDKWNHLIVTRDYETGTIAVYKGGQEIFNDDNEFSDTISFSQKGTLRIGKSQDETDEDTFEGSICCVQWYKAIVKEVQLQRFCRPDNWNINPVVRMEESVDGTGRMCLSNEVPLEEVLTLTTITKGPTWNAFLKHNKLMGSGVNSAYFHVISRDLKPLDTLTTISKFNTTGTRVCSRLCMRIAGCQSFAVQPDDSASDERYECFLYDNKYTDVGDLEDHAGTKYYHITN